MSYANLDSVDNILKAQEAGGVLLREIRCIGGSVTAATNDSGRLNGRRYPINFTVPSLTGYDGYFFDMRAMNSTTSILTIMGIEYHLGSISMATGTFTADQSAPTKSIRVAGATTSRTTAFPCGMVFAVPTATIGASATTLNITYTNQAGTGSRTTTGFILPASSAVQTAFTLQGEYLTSGDTGIRAITACTKSGATTGTIDFYGILPLAWNHNLVAFSSLNHSNLNYTTFPRYLAESGDKLGFYGFQSNSAFSDDIMIIGRPI